MTIENNAYSPLQVIERIREDFLLDIEHESTRMRRGAKNLQKKLNNALDLLSNDLYSKKSHFLLELIQNADDNNYEEGVVPRLTLRVAPEELILENNEVGFSEQNVEALCSVGESSKANKAGFIGEKGIGFKAVFTVSDAPEIHSNGYHFRFDRTNKSNLLGYVVPDWVEPTRSVEPGTTTIVLPAAHGQEFSAETIAALDVQLLLFLSKLNQINLQYGSVKTVLSKREKNGLSFLTTTCERPGVKPDIVESRFVRVPVDFSMDEVPDEKRPEISTSSLVLAFPIDESGAASPQPESNIFAFLPIRQVGFKFSIHADFILSSSREDILTDRDWNKYLRSAIAIAFTEAIPSFQQTEALALSYLTYIPGKGEISDPFFASVAESIISELAQIECLPTAGGSWNLPSALRIAPEWFTHLFPSSVAINLFGFDFVDNRVKGGHDLLRKLGAKNITFEDILAVFKLHGDWFIKQSIDWRAKFYAALAELSLENLIPGMLLLPSIPTNKGTLAIPSTSQVFYPLSKGKKFGFEEELLIIDSELVSRALTYSDRASDLFDALLVKSAAPFELVTSHILPKHRGDAWRTTKPVALLGHVQYIKEKFEEYVDGATASGLTHMQAVDAVRTGILVLTKKVGENASFRHLENLYLSKEYKPDFCIESLLEKTIASSLLVSPEYLEKKTSKNSDSDLVSWRSFFENIGVCVSPRLERLINGNWTCSNELKLLLSAPESSVRKITLECINRNWNRYAGQLRMSVQSGRTVNTFETLFSVALHTMLAPTKKRISPPISEVFAPTEELKKVFGDNVTYIDALLDNEILDACKVTHNLDAKACLKRLRQLKETGSDTTLQLHVLYRYLEQFWTKDSAVIKSAFELEGLIRIKGSNAIWAKPSEVTWRSNGAFLDSIYPAVQGQYRDFSVFFTEKLAITKELSTSKWVEALLELDTIASDIDRRREALAIYRKVNRDLTPHGDINEIPLTPYWLRTFDENVFLDHRDELIANEGQLFANDAPELAVLFSDDSDISFLFIPPEDVPRLATLLDVTQVPRLSESIMVEVEVAPEGSLNADLTNKVRGAVSSFGRILYSKNHRCFEKAIENRAFHRLQTVEVIDVPELMLSVTLAQTSRAMAADVASKDKSIFVRKGARVVKDRLAVEICKILEAPAELADTFARVLIEDSIESVEDFLRMRHIGNLPADLLAELLESNKVEESESKEGPHYNENTSQVSDDNFASELAESATDEPGSNQWLASNNKTVSPAQPALDTQNFPDLSGIEKFKVSPAPSVSKVDFREGLPEHAHSATVSGGQIFGGSTNDSATSSTFTAPSIPGINGGSNGVTTSAFGHQDTISSGNGLSGKRQISPSRTKQNWRNKFRTKSGRLMSYAGAPVDPNKPHVEEDVEKVAARKATEMAAVNFFVASQSPRWKSLTIMPHENPGFDVKAVAHDDSDEFIEVKGQSGAWNEIGVSLTPNELNTARQFGDKYWLCVVEHVHDEKRRALYLLKNPFGLTQEFRFDSGWRSAAINEAVAPLKPAVGLFVEIPGAGRGRIISIKKANQFFKMHLIFEGGRQANNLFNPATMKLSQE